MTPWRFWFPHPPDNGTATPKAESRRDAALWSPQAIAEAQRAVWQHTTHATEDWWRYWRSLWPSVPVQPPAGVVTPPKPTKSAKPSVARPEQPARRRRVSARPAEPSVSTSAATKPGVTSAKRARPVARGK